LLQRILLCALAPLAAALLAVAPITRPTPAVQEQKAQAHSQKAHDSRSKAGAREPKTGKVRWVPASRKSYERAHRPNSKIKRIIIHVAQAPAGSVLNTFRNGNVSASSHYVVSSSGQVFHMVPDRSIAWHSGNRTYNATSIGIEHAGYVQKKKSLTEPMYRASANLVARLADRYGIPLDRQHVIGHNEVPDPNHPRQRGGFDHHTDPGRYWKWGEYMRYARGFERDANERDGKAAEQAADPKPKHNHKDMPNPGAAKHLGEIAKAVR
jgi:N-acetyl-anhydromuramyl-L-alanine amidase AmpD